MIIGIVGSQQDKFNPVTEQKARTLIREIIARVGVMGSICSGECPNGGIDLYAHEEADAMGVNFIAYPPKVNKWEGGYKQRNILIAQTSDLVVCVSVLKLPEGYTGMKFWRCYHHDDESDVPSHVKSGGCWTTQFARSLGKPTELHVVAND